MSEGIRGRAKRLAAARLQEVWPKQHPVAFCWRTGMIGIGPFIPAGALPIVAFPDEEKLRTAIDGNARHSYPPNSVPLVPGIPEAETDSAALDALHIFTDRVRKALGLSV